MSIKDFITVDSVSFYVNLFITFFFANVFSKYVIAFIDLHISSLKKNKLDKIKYDENLTFKLIELFNHKELKKLLDDIYKGFYSPEQSENIDKLFEIGKYDKFFNRKIQKTFEKYFNSFQELKDFIKPLYTRNLHLNLILRDIPEEENGCFLTDKRIHKICSLANLVEDTFLKFEKCIRNYLPTVFVTS